MLQNHKCARTDRGYAMQATGLCSVSSWRGGGEDAPKIDAFVNAVTGWDLTMDAFLIVGNRKANMRQAFNVRKGLKPSDLQFPDRVLGKPPLKSGPLAGVTIEKQVNERVEECFKSMDWNLETGKPSRKKLIELGLEQVVKDL